MVLFEMIMQREGEGEVFQGTRIMYTFPPVIWNLLRACVIFGCIVTYGRMYNVCKM